MAIAFDSATASAETNSSTKSLNHTTSGANNITFVSGYVRGSGNNCTGVTCDGVPMTQIETNVVSGTTYSDKVFLFYIVGLSAGSHTFVASFNSSNYNEIIVTSYTGAQQTSQPDNSRTDTTNAGSYTISLTPVADECWVVLVDCGSDSAGTAGTNSTLRSNAGNSAIFDSNGAITPPASFGMQLTGLGTSTGRGTAFIMASFAPATSLDLPTVTTSAVSDIADVSATGNGNITDEGVDSPDERGFVFDTASHGDPGNVAPASSAYGEAVTETGSFSTGAYTGALSTLTPSTTYYVRAYAHNSDGYDYGSEVSFDTLSTPPFRFSNLPGITYDPDDTQTIFAERLNDILERIEALESA